MPAAAAPEPVENKEAFTLDESRSTAFKNGKQLNLTVIEYSILKYFIEHPDVPVSREELLKAVWGYDFNGDTEIVNVNIHRLRHKIEKTPSKPEHLLTEWGAGYIWKP